MDSPIIPKTLSVEEMNDLLAQNNIQNPPMSSAPISDNTQLPKELSAEEMDRLFPKVLTNEEMNKMLGEQQDASIGDLAEYAFKKGMVELPYKTAEFATKLSPPDLLAQSVNYFLDKAGSDKRIPTISEFFRRQAETYAPTPEQSKSVHAKYPIAAPVAEMLASAPVVALATLATGGGATPMATGASVGALLGAIEGQDKPTLDMIKDVGYSTLMGGAMGKAADIAGLELKPSDREALDLFKRLNKPIDINGSKVRVGDYLMSQPVEGAPILGRDLQLLKEAKLYNTADDFINAVKKTYPDEIRTQEQLLNLWNEANGPARNELPSLLTKQETPLMSLINQKNIAEAALKDSNYDVNNPIFKDESKRLFQNIADYIEQAPDQQAWLNQLGLSPSEVAAKYRVAASEAGRSLKQLSDIRKALNKLPKDHPLRAAMDIADPPKTAWDYLRDAWNFFDRFRLGAMVSQTATTARNIISQAGRYTINVFDDALQGAIKTLGGAKPQDALASLMNDISAVARFAGTRYKDWVSDIDGLIAKFPKEKNLLFNSPVSDVVLGGNTSFLQRATNVRDSILRKLNTLNSSQEYFFRRLTFDAKIRSMAQEKGIPLSQVTQDMVEKAVSDSLEMTFAVRPKQGFGNSILNVWRELPFLSVIHPYPRFWLNAMKFMYDFSPAGIVMPAVKQISGKAASGELVKALSRATIGTAMFGIASALRSDPEYRGEKWYEIKYGDRYIDTRAFSPFSTYLFLAELFQHPELLKDNKYDLAEGLLSISRIGATGFSLIDATRGNLDSLGQVVGQYLGGFTVPLRTVKDVISYFDGSEQYSRNTKTMPLLGPALENIPYASQAVGMAPSINILTGKPYERQFALERQATGITSKVKDNVQKEVDRLLLQRLEPKTGEPELDNIIKKRIGWINNFIFARVFDSPQYKLLSEESKKNLINNILSKTKSFGKNIEELPFYVNKIDKVQDRYDYLSELVRKNKLSKQNALAVIAYSKLKNYITEEQARTLAVKASDAIVPSFEQQ